MRNLNKNDYKELMVVEEKDVQGKIVELALIVGGGDDNVLISTQAKVLI